MPARSGSRLENVLSWAGTLGIVLLWIIMMVLLVKQEFFPSHGVLLPLKERFILTKILQAPESSEMVIFSGQDMIGTFSLDPKIRRSQQAHPNAVHHTLVTLHVKTPVFSRPVSVRLSGRLDFSRQAELLSFKADGVLDQISFQTSGDVSLNRIDLEYRLPGDATAPSQKVSIPYGLDPAQSLKNAPEWALPLSSLMTSMERPRNLCYHSHLKLGRERIPVFIMETVSGDQWVKLYISRVGQLLKMDTSFGIRMLTDDFDLTDQPADPQSSIRNHEKS